MANDPAMMSSTMDIRFNCPRCGQSLSVEKKGAGMVVNCPTCQEQVEIPHAAAPQVNVPTQLGGVAPAKLKISIVFVATAAVVVCALALATMYFQAAKQRSNRAEQARLSNRAEQARLSNRAEQAQLAGIDLEIQETEQQVAEAKATLDAELAKPEEVIGGLSPDAITEQIELLKSAQADYARKAKHLKLLREAREKIAGTHGKIER
jgi:endogenous inhibitor of DNA gyrase (YacG/DUF329 family)